MLRCSDKLVTNNSERGFKMDALTKQALEMFPKLTYEERLIVHALIKAKLCEKECPSAHPEKVLETDQA